MKLQIGTSVLLALCWGTIGCSPSVKLRVLEPAAVAVPPHIDTVAVVARTRPSTGGQKVLNVLEGALTGEAIGTDREGAARAKQGVVAALAESPRYDVVVPPLELQGVGSGVSAPPLAWQRVERICEDVGAQGLVVLEAFDTDSHIDESVENRTRTNDAGKEVHYKVFHAQRHTHMASTWRFYDASTRLLLDELYDHANSRSWEESGDTPEVARSKLPAQLETVRHVAFDAGEDYGRRIAPSWLWVRRAYYGRGDPGLKQAKKHVKATQWAQAEAIWQELTESEDPTIQGKALFNLALAREREGELDRAAELSRQADALLDKGRSRDYVSTLETRRAKQVRLEQQMRVPGPPPEIPPPPVPPPAHAPAPDDSGDETDEPAVEGAE